MATDQPLLPNPRRHISQLCSHCSTINFSMLLLPYVSEVEDLWTGVEPTNSGFFQKDQSSMRTKFPRLGTIGRILGNQEKCDLCRIFGKLIIEWANIHGTNMYMARPLENQHLVCWIDYCAVRKFGNFRARAFSLGLNIGKSYEESSIARISSCMSASQVDNETNRSALTEDGNTPSLFFSSRPRPLQLDPSLLINWINICNTQHQLTCGLRQNPLDLQGDSSRARPSITNEPDLRLIDVLDRCIVITKLGNQPKYAALSYVWGKCMHPTVLHSGNITLLQNPDTLSDAVLPQTVADFLNLVSSLEIRYAWVDALCILQDDGNDLIEQISNMRSIFSGAFVTVINAGGDNLDAGLPGVRADTRHKVQEEITVLLDAQSTVQTTNNSNPDTITLMTTLNPTNGSSGSCIQLSKLLTRCWTYQERLLSSRVLIFTPDQVLWICPGARFSEETLAECEQDFVNLEVVDLNIDLSLADSRTANDTTVQDRDNLLDELWRQYYSCVTTFSSRDLTYEGDVYNAFLGIEQNFTYRTGDKLIWGLPAGRFNLALGWDTFDKIETTSIRRRVALSTSRMPPQMISIVFPSWSWMGWIGCVGMTTLFQGGVGRNASVECYLHTTTPVLSLVPASGGLPPATDTTRQKLGSKDCKDNSQITVELVIKEYPWLTTRILEQIPDRTLLFFWSETSVFRVEYPSTATHGLQPNSRGKARPTIWSHEGAKVGECCSNAIDVPETTKSVEFVLIGTRKDEFGGLHATVDEMRVMHIEQQVSDESLAAIEGIYERVSIGLISRSAWHASRRKRKLIILR